MNYVNSGYLALDDPQRISHIRVLFRQVVSVFKHLHLKVGLAHRDLKLDNLMLNFETRKIKVIDLGLASKIRDENHNVITLLDTIGSIVCRPPEMLRVPLQPFHGDKADIFGLGVVLFTLIFIDYPFKFTS